jgi:FtsH-binding integral membrane protein
MATNTMNSYDNTRGPFPAATAGRTSVFLNAVYGWMCFGLIVTAATAWFTASSPTLVRTILANGPLFWGLAFVQLAIVFVLSARVQQLSSTTAAMLFIAYSALTGLTLSFVLLAYTGESIATTFLVSGGTFAGLAIYGTTTKRSLSGLGQVLFMGLLGVVLASIVGIFWHSDALQFVLSFVGVIVFAGLTAYDAQRLAVMAREAPSDDVSSYAIVGALALYLDFMNLFLFLLRFTGNRRQQ